MVSVWWILAAFVLGGYAGAILVAALNVGAREEEPGLQGTGEALDEAEATPRLSF